MVLAEWAILLLVLGLALLVAELLLPSHGVLGIMAVVSLGGSIACCYFIHPYLGLGATAAGIVAAPVAFTLFVRYWPRTRMGRQLVLPGPSGDDAAAGAAGVTLPPLAVQIGQTGRAVSDLRPSGLCEFGPGPRVEVTCDVGMIPAGARVRVIDVVNRRPVVRQA